MKKEPDIQEKLRCPECKGISVYTLKDLTRVCRTCGCRWTIKGEDILIVWSSITPKDSGKTADDA